MSIRDLVPWRRRNGDRALTRWEADPFRDLWREVDRLFERFGRMTWLEPFEEGLAPFRSFAPAVDVSETDDEVHVTAELPGLEKDDIEISVEDDSLVLSGEKKEEEERRGKGYYRCERYYGSFNRRIPLPCEVQSDRAEATFKNGVLTVRIPKTEEARRKHRKIQIKSA